MIVRFAPVLGRSPTFTSEGRLLGRLPDAPRAAAAGLAAVEALFFGVTGALLPEVWVAGFPTRAARPAEYPSDEAPAPSLLECYRWQLQ